VSCDTTIYAALALFGKEEKEKSSSFGSSGFGSSGMGRRVDVPGKLRLPTSVDPLEFVIPDMETDLYTFQGFAIYPLRSLLPPINLARCIGE